MLMLAPPGTTYEEEVCRRNNATNAVTAYCRFQEGETNKREKRSTGLVKPRIITAIEAAQPVTDPAEQALETAMLSVFKEKRPTRCFVCLGNKNLPLSKRVHCFGTSTDLSKHFRWRHLSQIKDGEKVGCEVCNISLKHTRCTCNGTRLTFMGQSRRFKESLSFLVWYLYLVGQPLHYSISYFCWPRKAREHVETQHLCFFGQDDLIPCPNPFYRRSVGHRSL